MPQRSRLNACTENAARKELRKSPRQPKGDAVIDNINKLYRTLRMKSNRKFLIFAILVYGLLSQKTQAQIAPQPLSEIAQSRYWKVLLHYKKTILRGEASEADGPDFFFSKTGNTDPLAELEATLIAFSEPSSKEVGFFKQHPQCAFPERYRFLKEKLNLNIPEINCREFKEWKTLFNPRSVTLVYAAPYLGDPASMFGHSFLRIDSTTSKLLDSGISYEAMVDSNMSIGYAIKGLIGSYPGMFFQQPYYVKINTYSYIENRDLWEYELSLDKNQIDRLLNHLWEMTNTHFDYYFLNENCSYHLLSLLEVANPEWNFRDQFNILSLPLETIRAVTEAPGAVRSVQRRPALIQILENRIYKMNKKDRQEFFNLQKELALSGHESAAVLDALIDWQKYQSRGHDNQLDPKLLNARAEVKTVTETPVIEKTEPPQLGHKSYKISVATQMQNEVPAYNLMFRPGLHDVLDRDTGYIPFSSLTLAEMELVYRPNLEKLNLEKFIFVDLMSLTPQTFLSTKPSWLIHLALDRPADLNCFECLMGQIQGGLGESVWLFKGALIYGFIKGQAETSSAFLQEYQQSSRFGPSIEAGSFIQWHPLVKMQLAYEKFWYFPYIDKGQFSRGLATLSYAQSSFEFRVGGELYALPESNFKNLKLAMFWYY